MFTIELKKHYWIDGSIDDSDDLCLHGDVAISVGDERFEASCTVSAAALYLLKTLTENHVIYEDNQMFPCCGHFCIPNETNDTVHISGCPNGIDLSIIHVGDSIEISTEKGIKTLIEASIYSKSVCDFADKIQSIYEKCSPKIVPADDFYKRGYVVFWNEWERRRNNSGDDYFCPAISQKIDSGLCRKYCFVDNDPLIDATETLKRLLGDTQLFESVKDFQSVCQICSHC